MNKALPIILRSGYFSRDLFFRIFFGKEEIGSSHSGWCFHLLFEVYAMFGCNDFWDKKKEVKNKKKNGWKKDVFSKGRDKRKLVGPDFFFIGLIKTSSLPNVEKIRMSTNFGHFYKIIPLFWTNFCPFFFAHHLATLRSYHLFLKKIVLVFELLVPFFLMKYLFIHKFLIKIEHVTFCFI